MDIYIANLTTLTTLSVDGPGNCPIFFLLLLHEYIFLWLFIGTHLDIMPVFWTKNLKFQPTSPNLNLQKIFWQKKFSSPSNCSSGSVECCFDKLDETFGQKSDFFFNPTAFSELVFQIFFRWILFWTCRLQFEPPALKFRQKNQRFFTNSQHLWNKKKYFPKKHFNSKCSYGCMKRVLRKTAE